MTTNDDTSIRSELERETVTAQGVSPAASCRPERPEDRLYSPGASMLAENPVLKQRGGGGGTGTGSVDSDVRCSVAERAEAALEWRS